MLKFLYGFRKFIMGIIALSILIIANTIYLTIYLKGLLSGENLTSLGVATIEAIGVIIIAYMSTNMLTKIAGETGKWIRQKRRR